MKKETGCTDCGQKLSAGIHLTDHEYKDPDAEKPAWPQTRKPLNARSEARERDYAGPTGRVAFVRETLASRPSCEVRWDEYCLGEAESVHEVIPRSLGGVIVPGPEAERQGQIFKPSCKWCNDAVAADPAEGERRGLLKRPRCSVCADKLEPGVCSGRVHEWSVA